MDEGEGDVKLTAMSQKQQLLAVAVVLIGLGLAFWLAVGMGWIIVIEKQITR